MTVALVMMARNEASTIGRAIESVRGLVDSWTLLDTGSTDGTPRLVKESLLGVPGRVVHEPWHDFGTGRTQALAAARGTADWLLVLDADMTVETHPDLKDWLATDPDPDVAAWQVEIVDGDLSYRLPLLIRGNLDVRYVGATHEYLDLEGRKQRPLLGLTVTHHATGANRPDKHERDLELLAPGVEAGDPRATYYTAQALWCLGRTAEAADMYERRYRLNGWDEERWHAQYMAARLRDDIDGLIASSRERLWRPEPLEHAARIIRARGTRDDVLFIERTVF